MYVDMNFNAVYLYAKFSGVIGYGVTFFILSLDGSVSGMVSIVFVYLDSELI